MSEPLDLDAIRERFADADPHRPATLLASANDVTDLLAEVEQLRNDVAALIPVAQMYLQALDADPENEMLTLPQALGVTCVREAVERWEARQP